MEEFDSRIKDIENSLLRIGGDYSELFNEAIRKGGLDYEGFPRGFQLAEDLIETQKEYIEYLKKQVEKQQKIIRVQARMRGEEPK